MPAHTNLSFETEGATDGSALSWTVSASGAFEEQATFYAATKPRPWEDFEAGWSNDSALFEFGLLSLTAAKFTSLSTVQKPREDFEELWSSNQDYLFDLSLAEQGLFTAKWLGAFSGGNYTPGATIPDNNPTGLTADFQIVSPLSEPVGRVDIYLAITHAARQQLRARVQSPDGQGAADNVWSGALSGAWVNGTYTAADIVHPTAVGTWPVRVADVVATTTGTFDAGLLMSLYSDKRAVETFNDGWQNNDLTGDPAGVYLTDLVDIDSAFMSPESFEDASWVGATYLLVFGGGDISAALFDAGSTAYDSFGESNFRPTKPAGVDTTTDVFTCTGHAFLNTERVIVTATTMPAPLGAGVFYYVRDAVAGVSFKLALTSGGAAINITSDASAEMTVSADPAVAWVQALA